jgi:hypothetical protein
MAITPTAARAHVAAPSAPLRDIAGSTVTFASDGSRYAAWQESESSPIIVLDTTTGQTRSVTPPAGCTLQSQEDQITPPYGEAATPNAGAGRFLLQCPVYGQVLNIHTGEAQMLPDDLGRYKWTLVGSHYAESPDTGCRGYDECIALYDLSTGAISIRHVPGLVDLNRPGAPSLALCPDLRHRVLAAEKADSPSPFAYENGLFVHAAKRAGYVEIDRCTRHPIMLPGRGEPRDFDLSDGLLTWDTGYRSEGVDEAVESRSPSVLSAYQLATGKRRSWRLPQLRLLHLEEPRRVAFGYSTHAANTVFWIADRSAQHGDVLGLIVDTSSVYSAKF